MFMIELKNYIHESLLDDIDTTIDSGLDALKTKVEKFIDENYIGKFKISDKPNKDGLFEVYGLTNIELINKTITSLTNNLFVWNTVNGNFICKGCKYLESLKGAPKEVGGNFDCSICESLKTLEDAPEKVYGCFYCPYCKSLESLKGAPKKINNYFSCMSCDSLESLEGAPEIVNGFFDCSFCRSLKDLKGAPKKVVNFDCRNCKKYFTEQDIKKVSNVKINIYH